MQPCVATRQRALHEEEAGLLADDDVRDELLVVRVNLGGRPWQVAADVANRVPQDLERCLICSANTGEVTPAGHIAARQYENLLWCVFNHRVSLTGAVATEGQHRGSYDGALTGPSFAIRIAS